MEEAYNFPMNLDSIDICKISGKVLLGLSNLEGNTWDGAVKILSLDSGDEKVSRMLPSGVSSVRFIGEQYVAAGSDDGNVTILNSESLSDVIIFDSHDDIVSSVAANPFNVSELASAGWDGSFFLWNIDNETSCLSVLSAHSGHINCIDYNGRTESNIATIGQDGFMRIWDPRNDPAEGCVQLFDLGQSGSCLHWDAINEHLIYGGTDSGDISVFDARYSSGQSKSPLYANHSVHIGRVRRIMTSPLRPTIIISSSDDTTIAVSSSREPDGPLTEVHRLRIHSDYVTDFSWLEVDGGGCSFLIVNR